MVPAGQWQAVKDTLSRSNGRSLTTSDAYGNTTTITAYSNYKLYLYATLDTTTTNDTAISLPGYYVTILLIQQSLCYDSRYNDQYTIMIQPPRQDTATLTL